MPRGVATTTDNSGAIAGVETFWRRAEPDAGAAPAVFVHGVPTSSDIWLRFLEASGGVALDLPGFGRSGKPADFDYSIGGYDRFLEAFLAHLRLERFSLVVHDWGAAALATAQRLHERLDRVALIAALPLLAGWQWHRVARIWRTPVVGELAMGLTIRPVMRRLLRVSAARADAMPDEFVDSVYGHFDHGTQRAILKLYRSAPAELLAASGRELGAITAPSLVLWPTEDPFIPKRFGADYAEALGGESDLEIVEDAGHWPWLDRPELVERVTGFLGR